MLLFPVLKLKLYLTPALPFSMYFTHSKRLKLRETQLQRIKEEQQGKEKCITENVFRAVTKY